MLILIGGEKGGTGKSCLAQNLSVLLYARDPNLLIIDCDPQRTTSDWIHQRNTNENVDSIECVQMYGNIVNNLAKLRTKYKIIIIDCGGQDSKALRSSLISCTHALFPLRPKRRDLKTVKHLEEIIEEAKIINKNLVYSVVINQAPTLPSQLQRIEDAKSICREWGLPCLDTILYHRNIYDDSEENGLSIFEIGTDAKAISEINSLVQEFLNV